MKSTFANLPRDLSNTEIPMVTFDDGVKHLEFEFFDDKIEVFYLNRQTDETYDTELKLNKKLKKIMEDL